ncbi:MAG TPA: tetratricopeptide repeat protein [Anaeromyxobacteraceae bacterium]|jgi:tetratricopeptide (TPR) repeat protein|nr:tetratricopeptide repeat protein [Anaeromyxobacteraceae bacterium]
MLATLLALALAAPPDLDTLQRAISLLQDEDAPAAAKLVDPLLAKNAADPNVAFVGGVLRFHQQRYADAVALFDAAGLDTPGDPDYRGLARVALEVTKNHARAESAHFVVSYPRGKDEVLVPYVLEALEAQRAALQQDLGYAPPGKVTIEFLDDTRALAKLSTLREEEIKTSGTIAICKFDKLMVVSPKALLQGYDWLDTAAHEYVHYVVTQRTRNNTPIWLHEGLAKFEETRWRGKGGEALSAEQAGMLRDAARKGQLITFAQMHPSMAKLPSQHAAALAFAEVMVAVEYLESRGGGRLMNAVLDGLAGGATAEDAVAKALGQGFDGFLDGWKRYLLARPLPERGGRSVRQLRFKGDPRHGGAQSEWAEIPDEQARGFARLGEIMRERGRWEAARVEYAKAVKKVGPEVPVLAGKYATAAMMTGHDAEAGAALAAALRAHPERAPLHVQAGRLHVKRKEWAKAREELLLANRVDPFDPEIHAGLSQAAAALGDKDVAAREEKFAKLLVQGER